MASDWIHLRLSDVATFRNGAGIKQSFFSDKDDAVPLAKVSNFTQDSIDTREMTKVEAEHASNWNTHKLTANDILIATVGSWPPNWSSVVGKVIRVPNEADGAIQNQNTCCVIPRQDVDQSFLYYVLKSKSFLNYVVNVAQGSANQARVPVKKLGAFSFLAPAKKSEQVKIGRILNRLDKAIKLNHQINQTLEQIAQSLFKSWFVNFDPVVDNALAAGNPIPDELAHRIEVRKKAHALPDFQPLPEHIRNLFPSDFEQTGELTVGLDGWVPKGWNASVVGKEFDVTMGQSPPGDTYNESGYGMPFYQGRADFQFRFPKNRVYCTEPKRLASKGVTLVSVRAPVGDVNIAKEDCAIGRGVAAVLHKSLLTSYTYYAFKELGRHFKTYDGEGTVFGSINQKDFKNLPLVKVPEPVLMEFESICGILDSKIESSSKSITTLSETRDYLLPKLISGKLEVV